MSPLLLVTLCVSALYGWIAWRLQRTPSAASVRALTPLALLAHGALIFNSALGQAVVTFIEFRVNEKAIETERAKNKRQTISDEELEEIALNEVTPKMRRSADAIKDDHLRYQFLLAAGSCLARKKKIVNRES